MQFRKATKEQSKLRLALMGVSGSGKTYSALAIASGLGSKIAMVDTERGSASKYADIFSFDVLDLDVYSPDNFVKAIDAAAQAGYDVLIIDSLSHAWAGILEIVDKRAAADPRGNSFAQWRIASPKHNRLVDTILKAPLHIIATMRSKTEWLVEKDERGKQVPKKVGTAPVQRDGIEYEFDMVGDLNFDHQLVITKSRIPGFQDEVIDRPGARLGEQLLAWLESGVTPASKTTVDPETTPEAEPAPAKLNGKDLVSKAMSYVIRTRDHRNGIKLQDLDIDKLAEIAASPKASDEQREMADIVLLQKEIEGLAMPDELTQQQFGA